MKLLPLLLLLLGGAACQKDIEITAPTTSAVPISGRVIELFSRETVRSASIEFRSTGGTPVIATLTDAAGQYSATLPRGGEYLVSVQGNARGIVYAGGGGVIGDLIVHAGNCVARYGTVTDAAGRPVPNAKVSLGALSAVTARDGWYVIEFGCPSNGMIGSNTILMDVAAEGYASAARVVGRGIVGVQRFDVALAKPQD
jgi:hypothetical protein